MLSPRVAGLGTQIVSLQSYPDEQGVFSSQNLPAKLHLLIIPLFCRKYAYRNNKPTASAPKTRNFPPEDLKNPLPFAILYLILLLNIDGGALEFPRIIWIVVAHPLLFLLVPIVVRGMLPEFWGTNTKFLMNISLVPENTVFQLRALARIINHKALVVLRALAHNLTEELERGKRRCIVLVNTLSIVRVWLAQNKDVVHVGPESRLNP